MSVESRLPLLFLDVKSFVDLVLNLLIHLLAAKHKETLILLQILGIVYLKTAQALLALTLRVLTIVEALHQKLLHRVL
jgi:hypothetical protein